jgi:hypothetical protein
MRKSRLQQSNTGPARRGFLTSTVGPLAVGTIAELLGVGISGQSVAAAASQGDRFFDFQSTHTRDELYALYLKKYPHSKILSQPLAARTSVFFYWDPQAKVLVNPFNLKDDGKMKPGTYSVNAEVYNFHPSTSDDDQIWSQLDSNVQMTFSLQAADSNNDLFQWIVLAGLNFADQYLQGKDNKLLSISDNNQLTNKIPTSQQVQISDGQVSMKIGLAGQKKKSWWDDFIQIFSAVANSPMLGLLPLPKLALSTADAVGSLLNQVEHQQKLVPVLQGKKLPFRLYDGTSTNPFLLKAGTWVVMDSQAALSHISGDDHNINDIVLDIPDQLYELKMKQGGAPVDMTYSVLNILLPPVKAQNG